METKDQDHYLLNADKWLDVIDNEEEGEPISAPMGTVTFRKGSLNVMGAFPGTGKTVWGLQCATHVANNDYSVAYCTTEMTPKALFDRFWPQFGSPELARDWIIEHNFHVSRAYIDATEIEDICYKGFDFVVVDHVQELPFDDHWDLAKKIKRIAALAPETNTAILLLSQLKQPSEFAVGPPGLYSYSDTKVISEVVGVAQVLWRPDDDYPRDVELVTNKNRFGEVPAPLNLTLNKEKVIFESRGRF